MSYRWPTVILAALAAGAIAAVVTPRYGDSAGVDWLVTVVVALVAGAAVALATRQRTDDGAHVRDDALPPE